MKFNNTLKYLFLSLITAATFTACDEVDINERFIDIGPATVARAVLLEDYTGQNCSNCPTAHDQIDLLVEQYGDNIIPVSIHAGGLAIPMQYTNYTTGYIGLMTAEGSEYDTKYNTLKSWPTGTVNRGNALLNTAWASAVRDAIAQESPLQIKVAAEVSNGTINITTTLEPIENTTGSLQLWITEDGIVARQRLENGTTDLEYVHNHVFRAAVNGTWGEEIALTSGIHSEQKHSIEVRYTDKEHWDVNNLSVVAFYYNEGGVLQAARTKVVTTQE